MITDTFTAALARETTAIVEDVTEATREVAEEILAAAVENAPEVTGNLKRSGQTTDIEGGSKVEFTADYADQVHENPESEGFRFLESVIDERSGTLDEDIADKARR